METFCSWLAICRPLTLRFDVFFDLHLNERLSKQWWGWWFETLSSPLWRHCNVRGVKIVNHQNFGPLEFTVDQLMWWTIVLHIPRWRRPSPLRDFVRRLWPSMLWNIYCMHAYWVIMCVWIVVCVLSWKIMRIQSVFLMTKFRWGVQDDKRGWPAWCSGR